MGYDEDERNDEQTIEDLLETALRVLKECVQRDELPPGYEIDDRALLPRSVLSFKRAGLLTSDAGIVLRCENNREYQITITRSR